MAKTAEMPGGHVSAIQFAPSDPSIVYLTSDVNAMGIWKSSDGGDSWKQVLSDREYENAHQTSLAVHPMDAKIALTTDIHGKIWRTLNGGDDWTIVHDNQETTELWTVAIGPSDPRIVWVGAQDGSLRISNDDGATWTVREDALPQAINALAFHPMDTAQAWAGTQSAIYKTTNAGAHWSQAYPTAGMPFPQVVDVAVSPDGNVVLATTPQGIYRTSDAGASWSQTLSTHAHDISWSLTDPKTAFATAPDDLFRSIDAGATWGRRGAGLPVTDGRVAVHPTNPEIAILGNNIWQWQAHVDEEFPKTAGEGVFKTTDGGASWARSQTGFVDTDVNSVAIDPIDPNRIYVGTECSRGLYRTDDGGNSWRLVSGGPPDGKWDIAHYTMRLATDTAGNLHLTGRFGYASTQNGAASWASGLDRRHFHAIDVSPNDADTVFMGTSYESDGSQDPNYFRGNHLLRSLDGGAHWTDVSQGFPNLPPTTVQSFGFDPDDPDLVWVATSTNDILGTGPDGDSQALGVYRSEDGGSTWTAANTGIPSLQVDALLGHGDALWAGSAAGLLKSPDGGSTWSLTALVQPVLSLQGDPNDPATIYAGTVEGLYRTMDSGTTWNRLGSVPVGRVTDLAMDPGGRVLVAAVNDHGVWKGIAG